MPKNKAKLSLLWVTPYLLSAYGDGVHERALVKHMAKLDSDITVISLIKILAAKQSNEETMKTVDAIHVCLLPTVPPYFISGFFWAVAVSFFLAITRLRRKFNVICVRDAPMALGFVAMRNLHGLPIVVRVGGFLSDESLLWFSSIFSRGLSALLKVMEGYVFTNADLVVAYSQSLRQELVQNCNVYPYKIVLSTVGVDPMEFEPSSQTPKKDHTHLIGYVGSMAPWQGLDVLVEAFALLQNKILDSRLLIVTKDSPPQILKDHIKALSLDSKIVFASIPRRRMQEMYSTIDVLVIPRYGRNTDYSVPIKLFEACAAGKAIVVSCTPSISSIMTDRHNCLFFSPGDYKDLASKIQIALENESLRRNLGEAAEQLADAYSWENVSLHFHNDIKEKLFGTRLNHQP